MPLPGNGFLTLQGQSRPGDAVQSKPKQAMIVRMSDETLDLLGGYPNQPPMDFEFGEKPGIHIGDRFFSMRPLKENIPHELYLRASSAAKPMAPLKLYALVTGKFTVERELNEKFLGKMRGRTWEAEQQRVERALNDRKAWPTEATSGTVEKQRKQPLYSSMFRNPVQPADHLLLSNTPVGPSRVSTPAPPPTPREDLIPLRKQLIHHVALGQKQSADETVNALGGRDCSTLLRRDILTLLDDVAEEILPPKKAEDSSTKTWRLKTRSWLEVRPYEWPQLTDQNRTVMARSARLAYRDLGIPEKDPAWNHVRYRNPSGPLPATPPSASSSKTIGTTGSKAKASKNDVTKRGAKPKEKVTPSRAGNSKVKSEVIVEDEGTRTHPKTGANSKKVSQPEEKAVPVATSNTRRLPGSGFKATKTSNVGSVGTAIRPSDIVETPSKDKDFPAPSAKSAASTPLVAAQARRDTPVPGPTTTAEGRIKKVKQPSADLDLDRDRDLDKVKGKRRDRESGALPESDQTKAQRHKDGGESNSTGLKRKKIRETDGEVIARSSAQKKRKIDNEPALLSSKEQDHRSTLPKKPEALPSWPKTKKEPSPTSALRRVKPDPSPKPLPRSKVKESPPPTSRQSMPSHTKTASVSSSTSTFHRSEHSTDQPSRANGSSTKHRRKSPVYTSSEGEEEDVRPSKFAKRDAPSTSMSRTATTSTTNHQSRSLPTDSKFLRKAYDARYPEYIDTYNRLHRQKRKIELLLEKGDDIISDSESEPMDEEELAKLFEEHNAAKQELEQIIEEHAKLF